MSPSPPWCTLVGWKCVPSDPSVLHVPPTQYLTAKVSTPLRVPFPSPRGRVSPAAQLPASWGAHVGLQWHIADPLPFPMLGHQHPIEAAQAWPRPIGQEVPISMASNLIAG